MPIWSRTRWPGETSEMRVRDKAVKKGEYGSTADAYDRNCPCRPCFRVHDYGRTDSAGKWVANPRWTREQGGCPSPMPEPQHTFVSARARVCRRCGYRKPSRQ